LRSICLVWVTAVALQILLNDKHKLESLQGDGSRTRQEIPQTLQPAAKLEPVTNLSNCSFQRECFLTAIPQTSRISNFALYQIVSIRGKKII